MNTDFWNVTLETGALHEDHPVRMRAHRGEEDYHVAGVERDLLTRPRGSRIYVLAQSFYVQPRTYLGVSLFQTPHADGSIGRVDSTWQKDQDIVGLGNAQAWFYPEDGLLVLWECFLYSYAREGKPAQDVKHRAVWQAFETALVEWFHPRLIVTPAWEPVYEKADWLAFLAAMGYQVQGNVAVKRTEG